MAESTTVTLRELLNDGSVQKVTREWNDVGLELGIPQHKLDEIQCDHSGSVSDRQKKMLQYWLNNYENPTLENVHKAIQIVCERRRREETRNQAERERKEVEGAVGQLEKFIEKFKQRNDEIVSDVEKYKAELGGEKEWMRKSSTDKNMRQNKELAATKREIQNALDDNPQGNQFAKDYLARKYGQDTSQLTEKEVEGYLHQALFDIESQESHSAQDHYKHANNHMERQTHLLKEIKKLNKVIWARSIAYDSILERLLKLGMKVDANFLVHLKEQKDTVKDIQCECTKMYVECHKVHEYATENVQECKKELEACIHLFNKTLTNMENVLKDIGESVKVAYKAIGGAVIGAAVGTVVFPILGLGTVIGAVVGGATVGSAIGFVIGARNSSEVQREYERQIRSQTNFKEQLTRVQKERDVLQSLLAV